MLCGDLNGKEIQKRGDIYIAESLCCIAEIVTKQLYSNNFFFFFNSKNSRAKAGGWLGKVKVNRALMGHQITHYADRMDST